MYKYRTIAVVLVAMIFSGEIKSPSFAADRPNFILYITDDISQEDFGCYGNAAAKTPNLDQMAAEGLRFTNAYLTCSSCSPSRCSLITGRYPHNTGACELHTTLPEGHFLFPQALKAAGYYTALSGKHHMGKNVDHAFDTISKGKGPGKQEDWVTLLQERPKDKPFFFWFASSDAHRDWKITDDAPEFDPRSIPVPPYLIDSPTTRKDLADYYHEVSRSDTYAGKLREELENQGIVGDTYVIYMSDNGRPFPRCKTRLYDSGVKSPLIIFCPGKIKPSVSTSLVSVNVDLGPTILELAGLDKSPRLQGVSLLPTFADANANVRDYVFSEHNWHVMQANERMVRQGKYLFIKNNYPSLQSMCVESAPAFPAGRDLWDAHAAGTLTKDQGDIFLVPRPAHELYDVTADPDQLKNLANEAAFASQVSELSKVLDDWSTQTKDSISSDPTPDRQTARGKKHAGWRHRIQPGVEAGSVEVDAAGPIFSK
ncbi:sulfatase [Planctomycetes bacterium K23_9]|uniref:Arylsulfatase n=1 Tax=Stieleria marina TaxID=1930275 RepID=A0A517P1K7_9BACT|nr:Arylsulfatase [Planctomycetes bacterium K23_9]